MRQRKLTPRDFLIVMTCGLVGMKLPSLGAFVGALRGVISREAFHKRFTAAAPHFLSACLTSLLKTKVRYVTPLETVFLNYFQRIILWDSSSWGVHQALRSLLPGPGGSGSAAHCKVQVGYDFKNGSFLLFDLTPGNHTDNKYTHKLPEYVQPGDLILTDLGYFCLTTLKAIAACGAYFVSRFFIGTAVLDAHTRKPIDLLQRLSQEQSNLIDWSVVLGSHPHKHVSCRLIGMRMPESLVQKRRQKMKQDAKRKGRKPSQLNLSLAAWSLMITNVDVQRLPAQYMRVLYTLRWQIELIFKQFKSVLNLHQSKTKNMYRLQCEIYGKLIVAVLIFKIHASLNSFVWNEKHRELSFDKFTKRIQERCFIMFRMLCESEKALRHYLREEVCLLIKHCLKCLQKERKTTLQLLAEAYPCDVRGDNMVA